MSERNDKSMKRQRNGATRRRFLKDSALLAVVGWVGCGDGSSPTDPGPGPNPNPDPDPDPDPDPEGVEVGMERDLMEVGGTQTIDDANILAQLHSDNQNGRGNEPVLLVRVSEDEVAANTTLCTHAQCATAFNENQQTLNCPCHGSQFNMDGSVRQGPAGRALLNFKTEIKDDSVFIEPA